MAGRKFTLTTDVSNFYPSIYTHAVDWAVRGKDQAKRLRNSPSLGASLDKLLRHARKGETVGVSIGPDTSWLISEVVLGRVDQAVQQQHPRFAKHAHRYVDDMAFYASSYGEAEEVLATYEKELAAFNLSLNPLKTDILDGIKPPTEPWVVALRQARYRSDAERHLTDDVLSVFSLAFDLRLQHPNKSIISYAIKRCNPFPSGSA